jgi:hypothetical protein
MTNLVTRAAGTQPRTAADHTDGRLLVRGLAAVALIGVALIHLVQLPDAWPSTPGLGALFTLSTVAATVAAVALVAVDRPVVWLLAALAGLGPIAGYVLTRSVTVPFDNGDVGNWLEPLGLVALFVEVLVVGLSVVALRRRPNVGN